MCNECTTYQSIPSAWHGAALLGVAMHAHAALHIMVGSRSALYAFKSKHAPILHPALIYVDFQLCSSTGRRLRSSCSNSMASSTCGWASSLEGCASGTRTVSSTQVRQPDGQIATTKKIATTLSEAHSAILTGTVWSLGWSFPLVLRSCGGGAGGRCTIHLHDSCALSTTVYNAEQAPSTAAFLHQTCAFICSSETGSTGRP